jgi:hypothetical protein
LAQQIASLKQSLANGGQLGSGGQAASGWGLGTSPLAVTPTPAPNAMNSENRQGNDSLGNTGTMDFEPLYSPSDYAHSSRDERVKGKIDFSKPPEKVEEIRSAPESQEAMVGYANIIGSYIDGEEKAVSREEVPLERQKLVKRYFDQVEEDSKKAEEEKK